MKQNKTILGSVVNALTLILISHSSIQDHEISPKTESFKVLGTLIALKPCAHKSNQP